MDDEARSDRRDPADREFAEEETVPDLPAVAPPVRVQGSPDPPPQPSEHRPRRFARGGFKSLIALVSVVVLALTGYAWTFIGDLDDVTKFDVLGEDAGGPKPLDGSRDILLAGMDSRTDAKGNPLPEHIRNDVLHVGGKAGSYNTDTIILLHIPQDTNETIAISIPRDSYVMIPGFGKHKVNSAYPRAKKATKKRLKAEGGYSNREIELQSNEAGARKLVQTVQLLTGRTIDNYASVNLLGFYKITKAVGGVPVCLTQAVNDPFTGLQLSAGRHKVKGKTALSFVRQRHGLARGGLDRVERQQAFMAGLARKILSANTLTNPAKLRGLVDAINQSIVLSEDWSIMSFAQRLRGLAGGDIKFYTIPVIRADLRTPADGIAVEVNPQQVRQFIAGVTEPEQPAKSAGNSSRQQEQRNAAVTVNVFNTTNTANFAGRVAGALTDKGFSKGVVSNAVPRTNTVVRHAPGEQAQAKRVAQALGGGLTISPDANLQPGHVTVLLAPDLELAQIPAGQSGATGSGDPNGQRGTASPPSDTAPPATSSPQKSSPEKDPITASKVPCVN